jgi:hypothetical protein
MRRCCQVELPALSLAAKFLTLILNKILLRRLPHLLLQARAPGSGLLRLAHACPAVGLNRHPGELYGVENLFPDLSETPEQTPISDPSTRFSQ